MKFVKQPTGIFLAVIVLFFISPKAGGQSAPDYLNAALPVDVRVADLLGRLKLEEKIDILGYQNHGVARLGVPAYNWWNEALHGVARAGSATVFPQAIGMAATFNDDLLKQVATAISTEARAKHKLS